MTPSLAWYLTSLAPLTREHAELTRFRASSGEQALFIAPERGQPVVRFVDKASGQWLPARAAQIEQTAAGRWLVADLAQRAKALEAGDDASLVAVALRIAPAGPDLTKLTWSAQAGFLEALETPDESV